LLDRNNVYAVLVNGTYGGGGEEEEEEECEIKKQRKGTMVQGTNPVRGRGSEQVTMKQKLLSSASSQEVHTLYFKCRS
jgi:hypothetical protein